MLGILLVLALIAVAIKYWYITIPVLALVGVAIYFSTKAQKQQAAEVARRQAESQRQWLEGPPPPLPLPGRFTENWLASNVPLLHPGQVPTLIAELRARGWTDERISQ